MLLLRAKLQVTGGPSSSRTDVLPRREAEDHFAAADRHEAADRSAAEEAVVDRSAAVDRHVAVAMAADHFAEADRSVAVARNEVVDRYAVADRSVVVAHFAQVDRCAVADRYAAADRCAAVVRMWAARPSVAELIPQARLFVPPVQAAVTIPRCVRALLAATLVPLQQAGWALQPEHPQEHALLWMEPGSAAC